MSSYLAGIELTKEEQDTIASVSNADTDNFQQLAILAGLDKTTDFKHSNLAGVDFSNSDLSGFDFTGADLRGAIGSNVKWDNATCFVNADIDASIFAHEVKTRALFKKFPDLDRQLQLVKRMYWTSQIDWISNELDKKNYRGSDELLSMATRLLETVEDDYVKENIYFFTAKANRLEGNSHRNYLFDQLRKTEIRAKDFMMIFRSVLSFYSRDKTTISLLTGLLKHPDVKTRLSVYKAILGSPFARDHYERVDTLVADEPDVSIRRYYLDMRSRLLSANLRRALRYPEKSTIIDFNVPITDGVIESITRDWVDELAANWTIPRKGDLGYELWRLDERKKEQLEHRTRLAKEVFSGLYSEGVPFQLQFN